MQTLDQLIQQTIAHICSPAERPVAPILVAIIQANFAERGIQKEADLAEPLVGYCERVKHCYQEFSPVVEGLKAQDPEIINTLIKKIYRWSLRYFKSKAFGLHHITLEEWATETTHRIVTQIYLARFPYDRNFDAWVQKFFQNIVRNEVRHRWSNQRRLDDQANLVDDVAQFHDHSFKRELEARLEAKVDRKELEEALQILSSLQQEVILMHYKLGLPLAEIAAKLGKNSNAVYQIHHVALKKLKTALSIKRLAMDHEG